MKIIRHIVDKRLPELFLLTKCGLEMDDFGSHFESGRFVLSPVSEFISPVISDEIPTVGPTVYIRCIVCEG